MSTATWKLWGNQVPFMRFHIAMGPVGGLIVDRIMDGDAWDGYAIERTELTQHLRDENIRNVVLLTGDIHANFAGIVHDDFLAPTPTPVATEFISAGVSSNSLFSFYESASRESKTQTIPADVRSVVTYDASSSGGLLYVENLNMLIKNGAAAARTMATTNNVTMALAQTDPANNPHLKYVDTNAQGFGVAVVTATQVEATLTTINRPIRNEAPSVKRTARFVVPVNNPGGLTGPTLTGTPPFPLT